MDYEKDIEMDESQLDVEWLEQPGKFLRYSKDLVDAQYNLDIAKENYELIRAKADGRIRDNPSAFNCPEDKGGNPKPTEGWIASTLLQEDDVKQAQMELNEARKEFGYLQAAVRAFDQRKVSLENLTRLVLADYFARPSEPRDLTAVMKERYGKEKEQARQESKQEAGVRAKRKLDKKRK